MNWFKKDKVSVFLFIFFIIVFAVYSYFNLLVMAPRDDFFSRADVPKFSSPDETANYFWIKKFSQGAPLYYFEELNGVGTSLIHLRSMNTIQGKITPGSFLGMIFIYGGITKFIGQGVIPFLTPFFSVLALIFFYLLINHIFKHRSIALISVIFLFFSPAWFYYSARGMYHNILFISLLLIGVYLLFKSFDFKKLHIAHYKLFIVYFLAGLLIGFSTITRTSEIVWIAFTLILIFVLYFRRIYWPGFVVFLAALWLPALFLFYSNQILYGAFISAGYRNFIPSGGIGQAVRSGVLFRILVTPFGFNLKSILTNTFNYLINFLPYWSAPTIIGAILFIVLPEKTIKINYKKRLIYMMCFIFISLYLSLFYGSWQIVDRIDNKNLSLGTSYMRYWLPIYIFSIPFLSTLIWQISKLFSFKKFKYNKVYPVLISTILIISLFTPSFGLVFSKTDESLFLQKNLSLNRLKSQLVNQLITADDIVIAYKQADKIFFPQRKKIITALVVPADFLAVSRLAKIKKIYYYTFAPPNVVADISRRYFKSYGLEINDGQRILGKDWLYRIKLITNN